MTQERSIVRIRKGGSLPNNLTVRKNGTYYVWHPTMNAGRSEAELFETAVAAESLYFRLLTRIRG